MGTLALSRELALVASLTKKIQLFQLLKCYRSLSYVKIPKNKVFKKCFRESCFVFFLPSILNLLWLCYNLFCESQIAHVSVVANRDSNDYNQKSGS